MKPTGPDSVGKPAHEGELRFGDVEAHAVRAEDADAGAGQASHDLLLEVGHLGVAGLAEAGGEEVDAAYALLDAVLDELRDDARGDAGDDVIDGAVDVEDAGVALEAFEFRVFRVDRVERGEAHLHEREEEARADAGEAGLLGRDAGDGDGAGVEDVVEGSGGFGLGFGGGHRVVGCELLAVSGEH